MKTRTNKRKTHRGGAVFQPLQPLQPIVINPYENEILVVQARNLANDAILASNNDVTNRGLRNAAYNCILALDALRFEFYPDALPSISPILTRQHGYTVQDSMNMSGGYYKRKTNKKRKTKRRYLRF